LEAVCENDDRLPLDQISRQRRQSIKLSFCPAIFNDDIPMFSVTGLAQAIAEWRHDSFVCTRRNNVEKSNQRHRGLVRARSKRPSDGCSCNSCDEFTPPHCLPRRSGSRRR
jgi:hypothetical protein